MVEGRGYPQYASALIGANQALVISNAFVIAPSAGIVGVAWGRTIIEFALLPAWMWAAKQVLPDAFRGIGKIMLAAGLSAILAAIAALAVINAIGSAWGALIAALIGTCITVVTLLALDHSLQLGFVANVKKSASTLFPSRRSYARK